MRGGEGKGKRRGREREGKEGRRNAMAIDGHSTQ